LKITSANALMRPSGMRRMVASNPGNELPGYFQSFLRNDPKSDFLFGTK